MALRDRIPAIAVTTILVLGVLAMALNFFFRDADAVVVDVRVPELSWQAREGKVAFDANCVQCHGSNARGSEEGPPLVHTFYNPGHHADGAFFVAGKSGVRQHHWRFGNMPPQPNVTADEMTAIIQYVRELQRANGITYKPHNM
jgi:mono/diheme cytochrome c family protein